MSFALVRDAICKTTPSAASFVDWGSFDAALVVNFTKKNIGDLHIDIRRRRNPSDASNKTHIDITSGADISRGLSPVDDFFSLGAAPVLLSAKMNADNIRSFNATAVSGTGNHWIDGSIRVNPLTARNPGENPSAQLLNKDDLLPLRKLLNIGSSLVLLRQPDGAIYALGAKTTPELLAAMRPKTKRMFLAPVVIAAPKNVTNVLPIANGEPEVIPTNPTSSSAYGQGRQDDPVVRVAVEKRGMDVVSAALSALGYAAEPVHTPDLATARGLSPYPGYDILATRPGSTLRVEVKATISAGQEVWISTNELQAVTSVGAELRVAVVAGIKVEYSPTVNAAGGTVTFFEWVDRTALASLLSEFASANASWRTRGMLLVASSLRWAVNTPGPLLVQRDPE